MKKLLILIISIFVFSACITLPGIESEITPPDEIESEVKTENNTEKYLGFIKFEGSLITENNYPELKTEFDSLPKPDNTKTSILLKINNHQQNLEEIIKSENFSINGTAPSEFIPLTSETGGHHYSIMLVFPKIDKNSFDLSITGLPVEDGSLTFTQ